MKTLFHSPCSWLWSAVTLLAFLALAAVAVCFFGDSEEDQIGTREDENA